MKAVVFFFLLNGVALFSVDYTFKACYDNGEGMEWLLTLAMFYHLGLLCGGLGENEVSLLLLISF